MSEHEKKVLGKILTTYNMYIVLEKKRGDRGKEKLLGKFLDKHIICSFLGGGKRGGG